jgi:hypothetical protein
MNLRACPKMCFHAEGGHQSHCCNEATAFVQTNSSSTYVITILPGVMSGVGYLAVSQLLCHSVASALADYATSFFVSFTRGINHRPTFHKHQLVNSIHDIFDPLPSLQAPSICIEFPNPRSSVNSRSAERTITPKSSATSVAQPRAQLRSCFAILLGLFWQQSAKVIHVIVTAAQC